MEAAFAAEFVVAAAEFVVEAIAAALAVEEVVVVVPNEGRWEQFAVLVGGILLVRIDSGCWVEPAVVTVEALGLSAGSVSAVAPRIL